MIEIALIQNTVQGLGDMGLSLSIASIGSAIGTGIAGMAAIGAWKKMITNGQKASTAMLIFVGAPLSQVIYGMILKNAIADANLAPESYIWQIIIGLFAGAAMAGSAIFQGKTGARACDAIASGANDTAKYIMVIGIVETVALFVMIFTMTGLPGS
ncbi:V-type ATP synthase subunit K [Confluentibacter citreus]|uniref:V-type ATP synthase subunit K n=1 Tax=Confluentibacter citreus TaxID=2007307 RepID=UPI000C286A4B|nr:V-type ATP synthase subunit K [Confluentibacter citreus]